jgi:hypothetical protein
MLAGCYDFLRTTPPYRRWKLPEAEQVAFNVTRHPRFHASHQGGPTCVIEVSSASVGHTATLIWVMGHEMLHLHQYIAGFETPRAMHNADFRRKAEAACRYHGWDFRSFV